jgi:small subunit ribosomal protein S16
MALKIRLTRRGSTHRPFYRLVVADSRTRRDGRVVDTLGYYNPLPAMPEVKVEQGRALGWLQKGATPSDTARTLLKQVGVWQRFQLLKQGKSAEEAEAEVAKILDARASKAAAAEAKPAEAATEPAPEEPVAETKAADPKPAEAVAEPAPEEPVAETKAADPKPAEAVAEPAPEQPAAEAKVSDPEPAEAEETPAATAREKPSEAGAGSGQGE